jgi:CheY-like chemotaxis protein
MIRQRSNHAHQRGPRRARAKVKSALAAPVLLVDDEPLVRQAIVEVLVGEGFVVVEADDGDIAIELLRAGLRPSLILLDLSMPRMDGRWFRVEQTKDDELRDIATVMLTGSAVDIVALGQELGGVPILAKPVDCDDLLALVKRHCAHAA